MSVVSSSNYSFSSLYLALASQAVVAVMEVSSHLNGGGTSSCSNSGLECVAVRSSS